jgi:hypothetical protein
MVTAKAVLKSPLSLTGSKASAVLKTGDRACSRAQFSAGPEHCLAPAGVQLGGATGEPGDGPSVVRGGGAGADLATHQDALAAAGWTPVPFRP